MASPPWAKLEHAYGSAGDVGGWLDRLDRRSLAALRGALVHQGSVYSATVAAVPLLIGKLGDATAATRIAILALLGDAAVGDHHNWLTGDFVPPRSGVEGRCYRAVARGVPVYARLLDAREPGVRAAAAFTLAWCGDPRPLRRRIARENHPAALASQLLALAFSTKRVPVGELAEHLEHRAKLVTAAAAIAIAVASEPVPGEARSRLAAAEREAALARTRLPWAGGDLRKLASAVRETLPDDEPVDLAALRRAKGEACRRLARRAVLASFTPGKRKQLATLTDEQRALLEVLAGLPPAWPHHAFAELMEYLGLPDDREALQQWLGLAALDPHATPITIGGKTATAERMWSDVVQGKRRAIDYRKAITAGRTAADAAAFMVATVWCGSSRRERIAIARALEVLRAIDAPAPVRALATTKREHVNPVEAALLLAYLTDDGTRPLAPALDALLPHAVLVDRDAAPTLVRILESIPIPRRQAAITHAIEWDRHELAPLSPTAATVRALVARAATDRDRRTMAAIRTALKRLRPVATGTLATAVDRVLSR